MNSFKTTATYMKGFIITRSCFKEPRRFVLRLFKIAVFMGLFLELFILIPNNRAAGDVVVFSNRTPDQQIFQVMPVGSLVSTLTLKSGESQPFFSDQPVRVRFRNNQEQKTFLLDANSAYYFGMDAERVVQLRKIGLGSNEATRQGRKLPGKAVTAPLGFIPVRIYVDEEEPKHTRVWQTLLRKRVEVASDVFERHCKLRFKVVGFGRWNSRNELADLSGLLTEFEKQVKSPKGEIAIGFTSQFYPQYDQKGHGKKHGKGHGRMHLGGTRGPFHQHILIREGTSRRMSEVERLELLVHELAHILGASHSLEKNSVMRPVLARKSVSRLGAPLRFDPVNTLILSMIGEEIRRRKITHILATTTGTKQRLQQIYRVLAKTFPNDPAAKQYSQIMQIATLLPKVRGVRKVLARIIEAGEKNSSSLAKGHGLSGDPLTQLYVRQAAQEAARLPAEIGPKAFLIALGIGLDNSETIRKFSGIKKLLVQIEPDRVRSHRLQVLKDPTIFQRSDLTKHFFVSAFLVTQVGAEQTKAIGFKKEIADLAKAKTGFSWEDTTANLAGVYFGKQVLNGELSLRFLATRYRVADFMPPLAESLIPMRADAFKKEYGTTEDPRFLEKVATIQQQIEGLSGYEPRHQDSFFRVRLPKDLLNLPKDLPKDLPKNLPKKMKP